MGLLIIQWIIFPLFSPTLIGIRPYPIKGDYGKKDLESANTKASEGLKIPLGPFFFVVLDFSALDKAQPNI